MKPPIFNPEWPEEVKALYRHDMQEIWDANIARQIWNQYHNQIDLYLAMTDGRRGLQILDVGCAQGTLALLLGEQGHRVWAIDIRQGFLDYAQSRHEKGDVTFVCGNVFELELGEKFDLIYANQVIEHMVYPLRLIQRLALWLKPGGKLVVTTPNSEYIKSGLPSYSELGDVTKYEHLQFTADADGHFFAYGAHEVKNIFLQAGLSNVRIVFFETPWISGHLKTRYFHSIVPAEILRFLDRFTLAIPILKRKLAHQLLAIGTNAL
jgi:2-polyprenyl-3-methyl-5-hydroxy-6-metoxy-1,4-benzoquinol methylase